MKISCGRTCELGTLTILKLSSGDRRLRPFQRLLWSLEGRIPADAWGYLGKEGALIELKHLTGKDFGYDADKWRDWLKENKSVLGRGYRNEDFD